MMKGMLAGDGRKAFWLVWNLVIHTSPALSAPVKGVVMCVCDVLFHNEDIPHSSYANNNAEDVKRSMEDDKLYWKYHSRIYNIPQPLTSFRREKERRVLPLTNKEFVHSSTNSDAGQSVTYHPNTRSRLYQIDVDMDKYSQLADGIDINMDKYSQHSDGVDVNVDKHGQKSNNVDMVTDTYRHQPDDVDLDMDRYSQLSDDIIMDRDNYSQLFARAPDIDVERTTSFYQKSYSGAIRKSQIQTAEQRLTADNQSSNEILTSTATLQMAVRGDDNSKIDHQQVTESNLSIKIVHHKNPSQIIEELTPSKVVSVSQRSTLFRSHLGFSHAVRSFVELASPDESASQVEKLAQAIGDSYKKLDSDSGQQVVVAYGIQDKKQHKNIEDVMIRDETEKLGKELKVIKQLSDKVKLTSELLQKKNSYVNDSHSVINAILKYADALLAKNKPEITINVGEDEAFESDETVHGWSQWTAWSECTMQCGLHSYQFRHRICLYTAGCPGDEKERKQCLGLPRCVADTGQWSGWSQWSPCSVACGAGGTRKRYRDCLTSSGCLGQAEIAEQCSSLIPCMGDSIGAVESTIHSDGWSECSIACGIGIQYKIEGTVQISRSCQTNIGCHNLAHWQKWQSWGACTVTCGMGVRVKARMCITSTPAIACHGSSMHTESCSMPCNAVNSSPDRDLPPMNSYASGSWTAWSDWTSCSVSCGVGVEIKYRRCKGECYGNTQMRRPCIKDSCQSDNVGFAERILEGDSTELGCPVEDVEDTGEVIWISPDGMRIDSDSQDKRFRLVGKTLEIVDAKSTAAGTYHCIVTHSSTGLVESGDVSIAVTTCESLPCKHGGTCEETPNDLIPWLAFTCHCPQGTVGTFCELRLSYSTEFWVLVAIITFCTVFCLCFAVFAISWKEQLEDHGPGSFNVARYFSNMFTNRGCRLPGVKFGGREHDGDLVRIDVSKPEGRGWLSRICRLLRCNRRPPELSVSTGISGSGTTTGTTNYTSSQDISSRETRTPDEYTNSTESALMATPPGAFSGMPDMNAINDDIDNLMANKDEESPFEATNETARNNASHNSEEEEIESTEASSSSSSSSTSN